MRWTGFSKHFRAFEPEIQTSNDASPLKRLLKILRLLTNESDTLLTQLKLHAQLAKLDWQAQQRHLLNLLVTTLFGFACFICLLIFIGILVVAATWDTSYRLIAIAGLCLIYAAATFGAWRLLVTLSDRHEGAFATTKKEIAADIEMLRKKLP